jgi:hypothetical protein
MANSIILICILTITIVNCALLFKIIKKQKIMSATLDQLTQDVTNETTVDQSAITLLGGLKTKLDAAIAANANGDDTQLAALSTQLETEQASLAAAIAANTPAAPATT